MPGYGGHTAGLSSQGPFARRQQHGGVVESGEPQLGCYIIIIIIIIIISYCIDGFLRAIVYSLVRCLREKSSIIVIPNL
jgi:hypothetical protein